MPLYGKGGNMHTVTLEVHLTDEEYKIVGRDAVHMRDFVSRFHLEGRDWSLESSLLCMLSKGIREEAGWQKDRDLTTRMVKEQVAA
jgi:hypothetical protein